MLLMIVVLQEGGTVKEEDILRKNNGFKLHRVGNTKEEGIEAEEEEAATTVITIENTTITIEETILAVRSIDKKQKMKVLNDFNGLLIISKENNAPAITTTTTTIGLAPTSHQSINQSTNQSIHQLLPLPLLLFSKSSLFRRRTPRSVCLKLKR